MPNVKPHSEHNAMATPTKQQTHARGADIKSVCVCVSFVYLKAESWGPASDRPINDHL